MTQHEIRLNSGFGSLAYMIFVSAGLLLALSLLPLVRVLLDAPGEVPSSVWFPLVVIAIYGPLLILLFRLQAPVTVDLLRAQLGRRGTVIPFSAIDAMQFYTTKNGYALRFSSTEPRFIVRLSLDSTFRAAPRAEQWRGIGLLLAGSRVQSVDFSNTREQFTRRSRTLSRDEALALIEAQRLAMVERPRWDPRTPIPRVILGSDTD